MPSTSFHGAMYTYPWDLADEGIEPALDRIIDLAGCKEVQLTPSYHVSNYFLPHNPRRPIYIGENGAVYFEPNPARYASTRIRPRVSKEVTDSRYFDRLVEAIDKKGLVFSGWIVYFFNHALAERYPEFAKHDAFGNAYPGQISPSSKDAQEYAVALTTDFMERYRPHAVRVEALQRQMWRHALLKNKFIGDISERCQLLLGLCFNPSSIANAEADGMDAARFKQDVAEWLRPRLARLPTAEDALPVDAQWVEEAFDGRLKQYLDIGCRNTTALWIRVAEVIKKHGGKVQSDNLAQGNRSWTNDLGPAINPYIDRMTAGVNGTLDEAKKQVQGYLDMIAPGGEVFVPLGPGNITDPGPLIEKTKMVAEAGAAGALYYNYGLLREEQLAFVGQAVRAVG